MAATASARGAAATLADRIPRNHGGQSLLRHWVGQQAVLLRLLLLLQQARHAQASDYATLRSLKEECKTTVSRAVKAGGFLLPVSSASCFRAGDLLKIEDGALSESKRIAAVDRPESNGRPSGSEETRFVLETGLEFEHARGEPVELKADSMPTTHTVSLARAGDTTLRVESIEGFVQGEKVQILSSVGTEVKTIFDLQGGDPTVMSFETKLAHSHPPKAQVVGLANMEAEATMPEEEDIPLINKETEAFLMSKDDSLLATSTQLTKEAAAGANVLEVFDGTGIEKGDPLEIMSVNEEALVEEVVRVEGTERFCMLCTPLSPAAACGCRMRITLKAVLNHTFPINSTVTKLEESVLGEYGFLTEFDGIDEEEARRRVRRMTALFGVKEFEFYNAFEGFSSPPDDDEERWYCACMNRPITRSLLRVYTDEIAKQGGRSWLAVIAMGTDPGDTEAQQGTYVIGHQVVEGRLLLDVVEPTRDLARRIAPLWAAFARSLGFSGIHWATVSGFSDRGDKQESDLKDFLVAAHKELQKQNLEQTWNFLNGFGWDEALVKDGVIAFTVWERYQHQTDPLTDPFLTLSGGVVKSYPPPDESFQSALDYMMEMWTHARCNSLQLLAIGDGSRLPRNDYLPVASSLTDEEIHEVFYHVFQNLSCFGNPIVRGVLLAKLEGAYGFAENDKTFELVQEVLKGVYRFEKVHVVAMNQVHRNNNPDREIAVRARRLHQGDAEYFFDFKGQCGGDCNNRKDVSDDQVRRALEDVLREHSAAQYVKWAHVLWEPHTMFHNSTGVYIHEDHQDHRDCPSCLVNNSLLQVVLCVLVVVLLCLCLIFLELCWHRSHYKASKEEESRPALDGEAGTEDRTVINDVTINNYGSDEVSPLAQEEAAPYSYPAATNPPGQYAAEAYPQRDEVTVNVNTEQDDKVTVNVNTEQDDRYGAGGFLGAERQLQPASGGASGTDVTVNVNQESADGRLLRPGTDSSGARGEDIRVDVNQGDPFAAWQAAQDDRGASSQYDRRASSSSQGQTTVNVAVNQDYGRGTF